LTKSRARVVERGSWKHGVRTWVRRDADGSEGTIIVGTSGRFLWCIFGGTGANQAVAAAYGDDSNLDDAIWAADEAWVFALGPREIP
jgi:hypothetical protein